MGLGFGDLQEIVGVEAIGVCCSLELPQDPAQSFPPWK